MRKLLLLITLMIGFMSFTPVEKGDLLKVSPMVEDVQFNEMDVNINFDLQNENPWIISTYNIPIEPGYTVSATDIVYFEAQNTVISYKNICDNIYEWRYGQDLNVNSLHYNNLGCQIAKSDNFTRWLIYCPERSSLPHDMI